MTSKIMIDNIKVINVSNMCLQTYPCKHYVNIVTKDNKQYNCLLKAPEIMYYLLKINQYDDYISHFKYYEEKFQQMIENKTIYNVLSTYDNIDNSIYVNE